jgi:uncharacterized membrane protein
VGYRARRRKWPFARPREPDPAATPSRLSMLLPRNTPPWGRCIEPDRRTLGVTLTRGALREETALDRDTDAIIFLAVRWLKLAIEIASVIVVGAGFASVLVRLVREALTQQAPGFNVVRLGLARYLALALELQLGADIIGTAISPSWQQIAELGAIAVIRTGLNFFLSREMREEAELVRGEDTHEAAPVKADRLDA